MSELRDAVKVLIERLETHPDEFNPGRRMYESLSLATNGIQNFLTEEENAAISEAVNKWHYKRFHSAVMTGLLEDGPPAVERWTSIAHTISSGPLGAATNSPAPVRFGVTDTRALYGPQIKIGSQTLTEQDIKHIKAAQKYGV